MSKFKIQVPDGRKITLEAPDEATAIRGAQEYVASNPATAAQPSAPVAQPQQTESPNLLNSTLATVGGMTGSIPFLNQASDALVAGGQTLGDIFTGANQQDLSGLITGEKPPDFFSHYADIQKGRQQIAQSAPLADLAGGLGGTLALTGGLGALPAGAEALGMTGGFGRQLGNSLLSTAAYEGMQGLSHGHLGAKLLEDEGIGAGSGLLGGAIGHGVTRLISPSSVPPERRLAAALLGNEGVGLTAGQTTGSKGLQYAESELGGGTAARMTDNQGAQFTAAALRRAGVNADRATPEVVDQAFTSNGNQFDALARRNVMPMDGQLSTDLADAVRTYNGLTNPSQRAPVVNQTLRDLVNAARQNGNQVDGVAYQALRSRLERAARGTADPQLAGALRDIRAALDDAMERGLTASGSPDLGAWRQVRQDYRNLLVIEKAATTAGAQKTGGLISPAALRGAAKTIYGTRSFARGRDAFSDLSGAGEMTMTPLPQSGTAPRLAARSFGAIPAAIGAAAGSPAGIPGMVGGAALGAGAPWLIGKALMSRPIQNYLTNGFADRVGRNAISGPVNLMVRGGNAALAQALLGGQ